MLLNLALVASVFLRRFIKQRVFAFKDERRLHWAGVLEDALEGRGGPESIVSLSSNRDRRTVEEVLLARLGRATPEQRVVLQSLFRRWGLLEWRLDGLRRGDKWVQAESALVLARLQASEALEDLFGLLKRAPTDTQVAAINCLELLGAPEAIEPLVDFFIREGKSRRRSVLCALIRCARQAQESILPYLVHPLPPVRTLAAAVLAEVASSPQFLSLMRAAGDPEPEVRAKVAQALGRTGEEAALPTLEALASDSVWYVRLRAVGSLSQLHLQAAESLLWRATQDKDQRVREKAAQGLYRLVGDPVYLLQRMREEIRDRYGLGNLVAVLEREGVPWQAIGGLCSPVAETRKRNRALVVELLRAEKFAAVLYALEMHPDRAVRQTLIRLLETQAPVSLQTPLRDLVGHRSLDEATRREVEALLARYGT